MENNEVILVKGKKHWMDWFWTVIWSALFVCLGLEYGVVWYALAGLIVLVRIIKMWSMLLVVSSVRIRGRGGVINIIEMDSPLDKIDNITVRSSLLGKILGYGNIYIKTSTGSYVYKKIKKPNIIKNTIIKAQDQLQEGRFERQSQRFEDAIEKSSYENVKAVGQLVTAVKEKEGLLGTGEHSQINVEKGLIEEHQQSKDDNKRELLFEKVKKKIEKGKTEAEIAEELEEDEEEIRLICQILRKEESDML